MLESPAATALTGLWCGALSGGHGGVLSSSDLVKSPDSRSDGEGTSYRGVMNSWLKGGVADLGGWFDVPAGKPRIRSCEMFVEQGA